MEKTIEEKFEYIESMSRRVLVEKCDFKTETSLLRKKYLRYFSLSEEQRDEIEGGDYNLHDIRNFYKRALRMVSTRQNER